jgi:hypothetical protein
VEAWRADGMVYYARLLGLRRDASFLAGQIKKRSTLPLITKTSCASSVIPKEGTAMWEKDVYASHLYRSTLSIRYQMPFRTEYEISPVIISS